MKLAVAMLIAALGVPGVALAADPPKPEKPEKSEKSAAKRFEDRGKKARGDAADPNIKTKSDKNDPKKRLDAPAAKGGPKTRQGPICGVHFDNRTPWKIQIYIDGEYRGLLFPWGDAESAAQPGGTRVYGRAEFDDGDVL